jgi:hypothetical protein
MCYPAPLTQELSLEPRGLFGRIVFSPSACAGGAQKAPSPKVRMRRLRVGLEVWLPGGVRGLGPVPDNLLLVTL